MNDPQHSPENRRAIEDGKVRAMIAHGIGERYHRKALGSVPGGDKLVDWVKNQAREAIPTGCGVTFIGPGARPYEAGILLARGLNLIGIDTYVVPLTKLVRWLDKPYHAGDEFQAVRDAPGLVITGFVSFNAGTRDCPMTPWQAHEVADFVASRITGSKAVLPTCEVSLREARWYDPRIVELLENNNLEFKA